MRFHNPTPPVQGALTSLIFPTYNPGPDALQQTLWEVEGFLQKVPGRWEVLFVCDGCSDHSPNLLQDWVQRMGPHYRLVDLGKNYGKGYAVRAGLSAARGEWRIFTDVDLSYQLEGVRQVAEKLWHGHPVVAGSRLLPESSYVIPAPLQDYAYRRRLQSAVYSALVRWLLPLRHTDTQAGLKGFSAAAVQALTPLLRCNGFSFDCELLMSCHTLGLPVVEVPVQFVYQDDTSTTNFKKSIRMFKDLLSIRKQFRNLDRTKSAAVATTPLRKSA